MRLVALEEANRFSGHFGVFRIRAARINGRVDRSLADACLERLGVAAGAVVLLSVSFGQTAMAHDHGVSPAGKSRTSSPVQLRAAASTFCYKQLANDGPGIVSPNFRLNRSMRRWRCSLSSSAMSVNIRELSGCISRNCSAKSM